MYNISLHYLDGTKLVGSAKSMEPDMVVEMVGNVMQQGVKIEAIIADDDTAAISNIHRNLDPGFKKYLDKNHIKLIV